MTRWFWVLALAVGSMLGLPLATGASHDVPRKVSSTRVGLVRAQAACVAPNAVHDEVIVFGSACAPSAPLSAYTFGPAGRGKAQVQVSSDGIEMRFALTDVQTAGGTPVDGAEFHGRVELRVTDHGCSGWPSCTVETSVSISIPCNEGRCFASQTFPYAFLPVGLEASAELLSVEVLDDNDNRFATQGILLQ